MILQGNRTRHCQEGGNSEGMGTARKEWALSGQHFMFLELSSSAFSKLGVLQSHQCSASFGSSDIPPHREMLALPRDTGGASPVRQVMGRGDKLS